MSETEWWAATENEIGTLEAEETHVTMIASRWIDGEWEYAIVVWRHHSPHLQTILRRGAMSVKEPTP